jgi:hypothetical protein
MKTTDKKGMELKTVIAGVIIFFIMAVMLVVFAYTFGSLQTSFFTPSTAGSVINETVANPDGATSHLASVNLRDGACGTITHIYNLTYTGDAKGNFTQTGCVITNKTSMVTYGSLLISYPYTWTADTSASNASASFGTTITNAIPIFGILLIIILVAVIIGLIATTLIGKERM